MVSVLVLVLGIVLIAFGYVLLNNLQNDMQISTHLTNVLQSKSKLQTIVTLISGVISIVIALLGFLTYKYMTPSVACPFIFVSVVGGVICLITTGAVLQSDVTIEYE